MDSVPSPHRKKRRNERSGSQAGIGAAKAKIRSMVFREKVVELPQLRPSSVSKKCLNADQRDARQVPVVSIQEVVRWCLCHRCGQWR